MIKPIVFENLDQQLVGILYTPIDLRFKDKSPGIVMLHGFTGNKAESHRLFVQVARKLCANGYNVLRFDFRGSGDSDGEFEDMTVQGEISDAKTAISFLMKQKTVDKSMVGVLGLSLGGRVASILATEDKRVRFVVLYSPALGALRKHFEQDLGKEKLQRLFSGKSVEYSGGWYLKKGFLESIDDCKCIVKWNKVFYYKKLPFLDKTSNDELIFTSSFKDKGVVAGSKEIFSYYQMESLKFSLRLTDLR